MLEAKNTKEQGNIGIGQAIAYFTLNKYTVSIPLNDSQDYDLIVDDGNGLKRVQVKTTKCKSKNNYVASIRTCGGNQSWNKVSKFFDNTTVELLFIVCDDGTMYCIPTENVKCKSAITLCNKYKDYKINMGNIPHRSL